MPSIDIERPPSVGLRSIIHDFFTWTSNKFCLHYSKEAGYSSKNNVACRNRAKKWTVNELGTILEVFYWMILSIHVDAAGHSTPSRCQVIGRDNAIHYCFIVRNRDRGRRLRNRSKSSIL